MRRGSIILLILIACFANSAFSQNVSSSASQKIVLQLNPIIIVNIAGINTSSTDQQIQVSSNSNFVVSSEKAVLNNTGHTSLSNGTQSVVVNGTRGAGKVFALNNTNTSKNKLSKNNTVSTIYTATEL